MDATIFLKGGKERLQSILEAQLYLLWGGYRGEEAHHFSISTDGSHEGDIRICPAAEAEALRGKEV